MSRYLVTGCAGFIGARVCRLLLDVGHDVAGVDSLNTAYDPRIKSWRLTALRPAATFRGHELDVADRSRVDDLFDSASAETGGAPPFDAVFHLAARAGVRTSVENPWVYYETNVAGTLNVLDACRRHRVPKVVMASTSSLYGDARQSPFHEELDTSRPLSPYAASKKAAEVLAYSYHYLHGLDVSIPRYFTVYGPAGRPDMSVFRFVRQVIEGEPLVVFGDGSQERDFTYVDDIARGTIAAVRPLGYEAINLGGDRPVRLSEVIRQIAALAGNEPRIEYRPTHPADVRATWADITKARRLLDWQPATTLEDGLRACVEWYLQNRELGRSIVL
ncbi:MAG: GDP-mannose 4,6-dehydratase [Planctomycetia bacterium]|nr:GDP-mannose 4,6-dehydratase [Planctomycetia bacterium]